METDFNYLSGERVLEHMSKKYFLESQSFPSYAEKLLLTRGEDLIKTHISPEKNATISSSIESFNNEISWSMRKPQKEISMQNKDEADQSKTSGKLKYNKSVVNDSPVSYGKFYEMTMNQQVFISIIDTWRKNVSYIFNESYKSFKYTLDEGIELLQEGIALNNKVRLPEFETLVNAIEVSVAFEEKIKKLLSTDKISTENLGLLKPPCRISITELYELLKEGESCAFRSNYLDFLKCQLEKLKSWKSNVQCAIIEKNLDKCKDSIKDKDEITIEVPGINDLTEQIAASNWIEKVERSLSRPMKLNFAENLLNEPAANFLDENVPAKQQLINRVRKAQEWLNIVQSPPFVYHLVAACKSAAPNDISESTQKIIDEAKVYMEESKEWVLPKPSEFEKVYLESSTLKIIVPLMKYMEPVYLRWRKWNKKYKRLMDGLCIYMEAQLVLEEAEYTLCEYLDMNEYLPELRGKIEESGSWLQASKKFLKDVSDFHTRQDINNVSSGIWNTISGIKKGNNEISKLKIQQVLDFMSSHFQERLDYEKLKNLIETGNELTIYETTILQELTSCQDSSEKWSKKAKEYLKYSKVTGINVVTVINLLLERSCVLVSKETEDSLFAELYFILWKMDVNDIQAPIHDFELNSLIERFNEIKLHIDLDRSKIEESVCSDKDLSVDTTKICESNMTHPEANYESNSHEVCIEELEIQQINISHWDKLKELQSVTFITKLQDIFIYWTDLIHEYEAEKKEIESWRKILGDIKNLPVLLNDLESKINKIIDDYDRIVSILKFGDEEVNKALEMEHPFSLLHSYKKLSKLDHEISALPIKITEWDKWQKHFNELNKCDEYTLSKFLYLKETENIISDIEETNTDQIERVVVTDYLNIINETLTSKSQWGISDFRHILADLKYTGRLIQDLYICENWIEDVQCHSSMSIEHWNSLLKKGRIIRIIDNAIFNKFEAQVSQSIEWTEIYYSVLSSDVFSKTIKHKRNNKFLANKILYNAAKLLVGIDYGIGERLITFRDLKHNVNSFIELRKQVIDYLNISITERRESTLSKSLNEYLNKANESIACNPEILNQIYSSAQFTLNLKSILEDCIKHPISMDLISYIQDEILLREINEKMLSPLINNVNPYFSTKSFIDPRNNYLARVSTLNEANDLIKFIYDNKLNLKPEANNINIGETKNIETSLSENRKENHPTIKELKEIILNPESFITKDLDLTGILIEDKYIDLDIFKQFKKAVYLSNEWLNIFKKIHFNIMDELKTESFYNKEISKNILSCNVKSSIDYLFEEYIHNDTTVFMINSTLQKGHTTFNQFRFELNWNKILSKYDLDIDSSINIQGKYNYVINRLKKCEEISNYSSECGSELDKHIICKNEPFFGQLSDDYLIYNLPLSVNLLHHIRNNKNVILNQINGKAYYEAVFNSVRSYINSKYYKHFTDDESFNLEQLEECLKIYNGFLQSKELECQMNETIPDPSVLHPDGKCKRNKRLKSQNNGEKVNEDNIDSIINLIRSVEMPTMELSLFLINYGRKFVKFELRELSNLCAMVECSLLWMSLIVNKFPSTIKSSFNDELCEKNITKPMSEQNSPNHLEIWEKNVCFDFFDEKNTIIGNINIDDILNSKCKHYKYTSTLKEFISLIETCDQLPIQMPIKSRLVNIVVDTLKWAISAREAILLLPKNTILCPWSHVEGIVKEITFRTKNSKIMKTIHLDQDSYRNKDEEIMHMLSNFNNTHEQDNGNNFEKNSEVEPQQAKKLPRPRGRPKREPIDVVKNGSQLEDIYSNICMDYKEIDQSSDSVFPKSFYFWLSDNSNSGHFTLKELLSIVTKEEDQKGYKLNSSQINDLNYELDNGYTWNKGLESCSKESINEDIEYKSISQHIGLINPKYYPKKDVYKNKLLVDYILCIEVFNSIQNNPAELCSICSNFKKQKNTTGNSISSYVRWIVCDECNRWYHQDCVGYSSKSNNFPGRSTNYSSTANELSPWVCLLCSLRSANSTSRSTSIINILMNSSNLELCHKNNSYILSDVNSLSTDGSRDSDIHISENSIKREVPSLEDLRQVMKNSLSEKFSFIKLHERNVIANKFYLHNVWESDFYRVLKWGQFELSEFNSSVFVDPNEVHDSLDNNEIQKEKTEQSEEIEEIRDMARQQYVECDQLTNISDSTQTSRKGRLLKNKISAKEMLNPKLSSIKPKKGRKRRIIFPSTMVTKQIRREYPRIMRDSNQALQVNFEMIFQDLADEYICNIDLEHIGRNKIINMASSKTLEIDEILSLYIMGILIGLDEVVEIEWLYCILKYLAFFNHKFRSYNENCGALTSFQISEDLSFPNELKHQKRLSWEDFKYILIYFSPNFPIKLNSNKIFYSNLSKVRLIQSQCISILNYVKSFQESYNESQNTDQSILRDLDPFKKNGKSFKTEVESSLIGIVRSGIIIPEENVISHLLFTYYLESIILVYGKQISNVYCNQLNPKPLHSTLFNINQHILFWKESDANLAKIHNYRLIPPEYYNFVLDEEDLHFQNQENKHMSRIQRFIKCCEAIQDSIDQCNEWNERYKFLLETPNEFEVYIELLKQGLNLPCIYPSVYSFGNILASIESYEDFINQVFDNSCGGNSLTKVAGSQGSLNQSFAQTVGTIVGSNQPSLNPKFENIQILKNIREFLESLPIQKNDLILKIDKMEENTRDFIEGIKQKIPQLKQLSSTEALISQLQLIKEEAIHKAPVIVNNIPELMEMLNNIPDFGSPHHNLLLRTQFLISLQCPTAKLRKPLNPFPNIPETSGLPNIVGQNKINESNQTETKGEPSDSQGINSNKSILHAIGGANIKFNTSCQLPNNMSFIWQNLVQKGGNPMNHYYYK